MPCAIAQTEAIFLSILKNKTTEKFYGRLRTKDAGYLPRNKGAFLKNIFGLRTSQDSKPRDPALGFLSLNRLSNNPAGLWDSHRKNQKGRHFGSLCLSADKLTS